MRTLTMRLTILTIGFSLFLASGCTHNNPIGKSWIMPDKPEKYPVHFEKQENRVYLDKESTINLAKNLDELNAYNKKLEFLVNEMIEYYTK